MKKNRSLAIQIVSVVTNVLGNETIHDRGVEIVEELLDEAFRVEVKIGAPVEITDRHDCMVGKVGRVIDMFIWRDGSIMVDVQFNHGAGSEFTFKLEDVRVVT